MDQLLPAFRGSITLATAKKSERTEKFIFDAETRTNQIKRVVALWKIVVKSKSKKQYSYETVKKVENSYPDNSDSTVQGFAE